MRSSSRQKGLSFVGIMWLILTIGFVGMVGLKLFPAYLEYYKVSETFNSVMDDSDIATKSHKDIWNAMSKRFGIDDVRTVKRDHLTVEREKSSKTIRLHYERRVPIVRTLDTMVVFDRSLTVKQN